MLPVLVCAEGFLLSHTSEVVDVPTQEQVDAFIPPFAPPEEWLLDPRDAARVLGAARAERLRAFQRHVADAIDDARGVIADGRGRVHRALRAREGRVRSRSPATPTRSTALVTIGTIGDTAHELLADDDDLLVVRVHAYRPFPVEELAAALARRLARVASSTARPRSASLGPLGADVRSLGCRASPATPTSSAGSAAAR